LVLSLYKILLIGLIATTIILFPHISYSDHGQEISILLDSAEFIPLEVAENQVNVFANYTVNDPSFINQRINSVMKVYLPNGTLIKTSSSADGFIVNQTGEKRHATSIVNNTSQNVIAVVQFTNFEETLPVSNPLQFNLTLTPPTAIENEIAALQ
jgi:peptidase E